LIRNADAGRHVTQTIPSKFDDLLRDILRWRDEFGPVALAREARRLWDRSERQAKAAPRRSRVDRVIAQAKKAGASSVTTADGVTVTFGTEQPETNPFEIEAARLRRGAS
jgi:hypothetical protein